MLDIELIRKDRAFVEAALSKRLEPSEVSRVLSSIAELDKQRRELIGDIDAERARRKEEARAFGAAKAAGQAVEPTTRDSKAALQELEDRLAAVQEQLTTVMSELPNLPADDVVAGGKEANVVVKVFGEAPKIEHVRDHVTLASELGLVDFERGVKLGGSGFWIYTGWGARLEWALVNWFIDRHFAAGYQFMLPPHLLLDSAGYAAGQFPKFYDDVFHIATDGEERGRFLLPTSETAILGAYQNEIFDTADLPHKAYAYTPCYRSEKAGSHSDERGTVRGHQFNKVEIFQFTTPEDGEKTLEEMVDYAEDLVSSLGLHFRRSLLAAGDSSASMRKTIDIEVWMPSTGKYKEVSSVSWAGDYQARRAGIRYRVPGSKNNRFVHTLNGSALATSRIFPAILEQFQQEDGSVLVPEVLRDKVGTDRIVKPTKRR
ncbi:serine--tRNA ligase [Dactylosporangium aurantiacum]|uniref:Serine--tRNA ligase n=1 Tax=Dactylosporangium aurantiacum TaxID=35754 RepID=A0A9Q9IA94_9ACTN|nr:serine--tRNA ligase [Dactylosporangium aurantiacum]MDG6103409.1 serine--tRNA ligase [Dactylosporangium aurantiacum]UWZ52081.1 serine--tRNA ligase [Dactylosporangium aurantiacum]